MVLAAHLLRALRRRLAAEHGGFIIEVVVSAALIVTAGGGALMAMDTVSEQTGEQRTQAVGADVAQAEMERLRAQKFETLTALATTPETRTVKSAADRFTYTVVNTSAWAMQAPSGAVSCTNSARNPEALRVSTTVTWPKMGRKPIRFSSLVAAPVGSAAQRGTYVVQVTDRNGAGHSSLTVAMAGPTGVTGVTDVNGCVRFTELPAGAYTVTFAKTGFVTPGGATSVSENVDVVAGQTRSNSWELDRAGTASLAYRYRGAGGAIVFPNRAQRPTEATVDHANMAGGAKVVDTSSLMANDMSDAANRFTVPSLYPFFSAYSAYAGGCVNAAPPANTTGATSFSITPNAVTTTTLDMPAMRVEPGATEAGDLVYVQTACSKVLGPFTLLDGGGKNNKPEPDYAYLGAPYGPIRLCVVDNTPAGTSGRWDTYNAGASMTVANDDFDADPKLVGDGNGVDFNLRNRTGAACDGWL